MATSSDVLSWRGQDALDTDGQKIGSIEEIYLDAETNAPEWALVNTGLFGTKRSFVPLRNASPSEGDGIRVAFDKATVKDAPKIDPDGRLSQEEEAELYRHYGLEYSTMRSDSGLPEGGEPGSGISGGANAGPTSGAPTSDGPAGGRVTGGAGEASRDVTSGEASAEVTGGSLGGVSGSNTDATDDAMTRSEEELTVDTVQRETGRARLKKYVVEDEVTETVPVRREELRVEREPITEANRDAAISGPEISEAEHEVVLHEEEPVAEKRTVPQERVRLEKDVHEDQQEVSDTVRKEQLDVDDSGKRS